MKKHDLIKLALMGLAGGCFIAAQSPDMGNASDNGATQENLNECLAANGCNGCQSGKSNSCHTNNPQGQGAYYAPQPQNSNTYMQQPQNQRQKMNQQRSSRSDSDNQNGGFFAPQPDDSQNRGWGWGSDNRNDNQNHNDNQNKDSGWGFGSDNRNDNQNKDSRGWGWGMGNQNNNDGKKRMNGQNGTCPAQNGNGDQNRFRNRPGNQNMRQSAAFWDTDREEDSYYAPQPEDANRNQRNIPQPQSQNPRFNRDQMMKGNATTTMFPMSEKMLLPSLSPETREKYDALSPEGKALALQKAADDQKYPDKNQAVIDASQEMKRRDNRMNRNGNTGAWGDQDTERQKEEIQRMKENLRNRIQR